MCMGLKQAWHWGKVIHNTQTLALPAAAVTTFCDKSQTNSSTWQPVIRGVMRETNTPISWPHFQPELKGLD